MPNPTAISISEPTPLLPGKRIADMRYEGVKGGLPNDVGGFSDQVQLYQLPFLQFGGVGMPRMQCRMAQGSVEAPHRRVSDVTRPLCSIHERRFPFLDRDIHSGMKSE